jgi:hypothetical protein
LGVALSDYSCFETRCRCFSVFDTKNGFRADDLAIERTRNEGPCVIGVESPSQLIVLLAIAVRKENVVLRRWRKAPQEVRRKEYVEAKT